MKYQSTLTITVRIWALLGLIAALPLASQAQVTNFPYFENFDGLTTNPWVPSTGGINGWTRGTPAKAVINTAFSAPNAWMTGNTTGTYAGNNSSYIESPVFDFSNLNRPAISFMAYWETEYSWDGASFSVSTDGGMTFNTIGAVFDQVNWYNDNTINGGQFGGPCNSGLGWTGTASDGAGSQGWVNVQHELNGLAGEPDVRLRFCFASDFSTNFDGFAFDNVIISDLPNIELGNDTILCFADTLILNMCAPEGIDYSWNTNNPFDTLCTLTVVNSGIYIATVEDSLGFKTKDTIQVTVSPTFVNLGPDIVICPGDTLTLNAMNGFANHLWLPTNDTSQMIDVTTAGTYTAIVSDNLGCVEIDSINIAVDVIPVVDLGNDTTICIGESIILDAGSGNPGTTYQWNFSGQSTTQTVFVSAPGEYSVLVTTAAGCLATDTMQLVVELSPVVDLGPDRVECGTFVLDALNPGSSYLWNTSDMTQSITTPFPGTYWVAVTNQATCVGYDTVVITSGQVPQVDVGPDQVICNGSTVTLDAGNPGQQYFWSNGATTQSITVSTPGNYSVVVTTGDNCEATDSVEVILSPLTVNLGPDLTICEGVPITLDAGSFGDTYNWNTGEMTQMISVGTGGTYTVTVEDSTGCIATDDIVIAAQPDFTASIMIDDSVDLYESTQFFDQSSGNPTSWTWTFGDGNSSTQQNPTYTYQALGTFEVCMTATDGICTNSVCDSIKVGIFVVQSIEEEFGLELELFPNPNQGSFQVNLTLPKAHELDLSIYDLNGKIVLEKELGNVRQYQEQFDLPNLSEGIYFLKLNVDGNAVYRKLLIE
ncbi:MAG: PKD domain-containing protein [Bacteroidota bacterium]